ncbi:hypothetical protein FA95DRAFT_1124548 [Auriscalpium vulgare]|uniref:Uncharacterized protein n=1 Tax=Auriscalpium vulgare TaxID=40419 RepID=A0ACB8RVB8_9AGAM|nr:hypothetical protein FA95DRAFT_1124548 [Auriscalpium vulgare]
MDNCSGGEVLRSAVCDEAARLRRCGDFHLKRSTIVSRGPTQHTLMHMFGGQGLGSDLKIEGAPCIHTNSHPYTWAMRCQYSSRPRLFLLLATNLRLGHLLSIARISSNIDGAACLKRPTRPGGVASSMDLLVTRTIKTIAARVSPISCHWPDSQL